MKNLKKMNSSGESGYPCFVSELRRKAYDLSSLSMVLVVGVFLVNVVWRVKEVPSISSYE